MLKSPVFSAGICTIQGFFVSLHQILKKRPMAHINFAKFDSHLEIADYFNTEDKCKQAIAQERWGEGDVVCPYCGGKHCYMTNDGRYICKDCQNKFSVLVGTIFENTKISLRKWFIAMYIISCSKNNIVTINIKFIFY